MTLYVDKKVHFLTLFLAHVRNSDSTYRSVFGHLGFVYQNFVELIVNQRRVALFKNLAFANATASHEIVVGAPSFR